MKNRLISDEHRKYFQECEGYPFPEERGSGRTTSIALGLISCAIASPGLWVKIVDHSNYRGANYYLLNRVKDIVSKLELKFFEFSKTHVRCNIFEHSNKKGN